MVEGAFATPLAAPLAALAAQATARSFAISHARAVASGATLATSVRHGGLSSPVATDRGGPIAAATTARRCHIVARQAAGAHLLA